METSRARTAKIAAMALIGARAVAIATTMGTRAATAKMAAKVGIAATIGTTRSVTVAKAATTARTKTGKVVTVLSHLQVETAIAAIANVAMLQKRRDHEAIVRRGAVLGNKTAPAAGGAIPPFCVTTNDGATAGAARTAAAEATKAYPAEGRVSPEMATAAGATTGAEVAPVGPVQLAGAVAVATALATAAVIVAATEAATEVAIAVASAAASAAAIAVAIVEGLRPGAAAKEEAVAKGAPAARNQGDLASATSRRPASIQLCWRRPQPWLRRLHWFPDLRSRRCPHPHPRRQPNPRRHLRRHFRLRQHLRKRRQHLRLRQRLNRQTRSSFRSQPTPALADSRSTHLVPGKKMPPRLPAAHLLVT